MEQLRLPLTITIEVPIEDIVAKQFEKNTKSLQKFKAYTKRKLINKDIYKYADGKPWRIKLIWARLKARYAQEVLYCNSMDEYLDRIGYKNSFLDFVESQGDLEKLHHILLFCIY
jgi:hypothetical protein